MAPGKLINLYHAPPAELAPFVGIDESTVIQAAVEPLGPASVLSCVERDPTQAEWGVKHGRIHSVEVEQKNLLG